ncbi:MAG: sugar phosphate isomerase/epimerase [Ruminococcaceae bacterium]|nr:sugar phosphate isomerase/epimerase [Oscillospiraceae bacterium]
MKIGAQFYTLREYCKTLEDFSESLKKVADIGYKTVQISGTCPFEAEWLKDELLKNDLKCVITHTPIERMVNETKKVIEDHNVFGSDCIGIGYYNFSENFEERFKRFEEEFTPVMKEFHKNGKYLMYHNHHFEFDKVGGKTIMEHLSERIPAEYMGFTLDTYWVQTGGGDPADWIKKLKGRVPCIHLKDYSYGAKMAVVGEGNINFDRVFKEAQDAGTKYMIVEQDECNGEDPFDCLRRSYEYLKSRGFE